jgi:energy-coupling factor transporter ATP-binding protein EcfA2
MSRASEPATIGFDTSGTTLLRTRNLGFGYGTGADGVHAMALRDITLEVRAGDRVGLMGASGSGKSTLLSLLAGLRRPQRGGLEVASTAERLVSLVLQFPERQLFAESVHDDVAYGLRESGLAPHEVRSRVDTALEDVGLDAAEFGPRPPFHLSGGEMRRVALAGALAQRRPILLLDEPTLGLDAEGLTRLGGILRRLQERGVACWLASHAADFVAATCDRLVVLDAGGIAYDGSPSDFWAHADRAAGLGVEMPRAASLSTYLRGLELRPALSLPALPDEELLASTLRTLASNQSSR